MSESAIALARRLGAWVAGLGLEDIPPSTLASAKRCLVDVIGVAAAGLDHEPAVKSRSHAKAQFARGPCGVLGEPASLTAPGAALANGVAAHVLDFDDTSYEGILHGSAVIWPAVMAAGETSGISGERFITAFIAAAEIEYALGRALADRPYEKGWWTTGLLGTIAAAAGAAKALGLDAEQTTNAISIAACQAAGLHAMVGTPVKALACGRTAQIGVESTLFAAAGIAGRESIFEHARGFLELFNDGVVDAGPIGSLGSHWRLDRPGIAFKLYPVCSAAQAAVEAVAQILREEAVSPARIRRVHCEVTPLVALSLAYARPCSVTQAQFSMPFAVGCMLAYGELTAGHLTTETLNDPALLAAMSKVEMSSSDAVAPTTDDRARYPEGAIVTVEVDDGTRHRRFNGAATGMPARPMSDQALERKFLSCTTSRLSTDEAKAVLSNIASIEKLRHISDLIRPLCSPRDSRDKPRRSSKERGGSAG